jgi:acyl-coenzyme A synthetase/AMP-(fatty) acid ligase/thioesterase domain-containing protein/acyl carrier protein
MENNLLSAFKNTVARYPEKIAATDATSEITYQRLLSESLCICSALKNSSFKEKKLAIYMPNGINALTTLVGSLYSGICFSVLDIKQPAERNSVICSIGKFDVIVTIKDLLPEANQFFDRERILIFEEMINHHPSEIDNLEDVEAETPAIMFFTSGSTGTPKAVVHTHSRVSLGLQDAIDLFEVNPDDKFDMIVPLGFTASMFVYFSLLKGSSLHFFDVRKKGIIAYVNFLLRNKINFSVMTVTAFRAVARLSNIIGKLKHFRIMYLVGEPVQPADIRMFRRYCRKEAVLVNVYGATETRFVSYNRFSYNDIIPERIPAGRPFGKVKVHILDENMKELQAGATGHIAISSPYMATGYFNNEIETRNSFIVHNRLNKPLYLTGDIGYLSEEGYLFHQGRNDFMVKVRGNRVDLFEIENCLLNHPEVADVAVVNKGSSFADTLLVAYFELKNEVPLPLLRKHVADKLPEYMVPAYFIKTYKLPKTATGKTDRKSLIDSALDISSILGENDENQLDYDPLYLKLKAIWMEELKLPRLSPNHCFFNDLGGDSILAVSILERIKNEMEINLPYFILFRYRTLGRLVEYIHRGGNKIVSLEKLKTPKDQQSPVIFFVPPIKGGADTYNFAIKTFPSHYGLYVITYNIIDETNKAFYPLDVLMDTAADLIDRSEFTNLYLFGYSMGGLLAFEMAQRTQKGNLRKVILIDIPPAKRKKINLIYFIANDIRLSWKSLLKGNLHPVKVNTWHIGFCIKYFFIRGNSIKKSETKNHTSLSEGAHLRYYSQFNHGKFDGDMLLICSTDDRFSRSLFNWEKYVSGKVETRMIDSGHYDLLAGKKINAITDLVIESIG